MRAAGRCRKRSILTIICAPLILYLAASLAAYSSHYIHFIGSYSGRNYLRHALRSCKVKDNNATPPTLPQIVHQSWKTHQLPSNRSKRWSDSWRACFPDWEHRLWSDWDNEALVRRHYPQYLPLYLGFDNPIERADLARYFYMHQYGGIYTDLDNVCLRNFAHLLRFKSLAFVGMAGYGETWDPVLKTYIQNSFMASRPGHEFWLGLVERVARYELVGVSKSRPEYHTGPYVLMDELREYVKARPCDLVIFDSKYFNPFSWKLNRTDTACKDLGRMSPREEAACLGEFPNAYVVQLHTQSWLDGHL